MKGGRRERDGVIKAKRKIECQISAREILEMEKKRERNTGKRTRKRGGNTRVFRNVERPIPIENCERMQTHNLACILVPRSHLIVYLSVKRADWLIDRRLMQNG